RQRGPRDQGSTRAPIEHEVRDERGDDERADERDDADPERRLETPPHVARIDFHPGEEREERSKRTWRRSRASPACAGGRRFRRRRRASVPAAQPSRPSSTETTLATRTTAARAAASWTGLMVASSASVTTFGRAISPGGRLEREP